MEERRRPTCCAVLVVLSCCTHNPQRVSPFDTSAADTPVNLADATPVDILDEGTVDAPDATALTMDVVDATLDTIEMDAPTTDSSRIGDSPSVTAIVAGGGFTCALTRDERVWCWGDNSVGQIGNGRDDARTTYPLAFGQYRLGAHASPFPSLVRGLSGVSEIAAGDNHVYARIGDSVWGWGAIYLDPSRPRSGGGYYTSAPAMLRGSGLPSDIVSISAGTNMACAITRDRRAICWGRFWAALGRGPTPDRGGVSSADALPVLTAPEVPLLGVQSLALGSYHACALLMDGTVRCWGQNFHGELGDGTTDTSRSLLYASADPGISGVTKLVAGSSHNCALVTGDASDGEVFCWGRADVIISGTPGARSCGSPGYPCYPTPTRLTSVSGARDLFAGAGQTCALIGGALLCWGIDELGQWRLPSTVIASGVRSASLSEDHLCARMSDDTVRCAGRDDYGATGTGATISLTPSTVGASGDAGAPLANAVGITVGVNGACAVLNDHHAECWGGNLVGVLPEGTSSVYRSERPRPVTVLDGTENGQIAEVGMGIGFGCARLVGGVVRCWGYSSQGLMGEGLTSVAMLRVGPDHACVLQAGAVRCWGAIRNGQIGVERYDAGSEPQTVPLPSGATVRSISVGAHHSCAVVAGGAPAGGAWCWGLNSEEQLGTGASGFFVATPARVTAYSRGPSETLTVDQVACGDGFTCALFDGGEVRCWGHNSDLFFIGTNTVIASSARATLLAAGASHACASDGVRVWCWGRNNQGQLGSGDTVDRYPTPVEVSRLVLPAGVMIRDLALGGDTSCVLLSDGGVRCWGDGGFGRLGDGRSNIVDVPTPVNWR